MALTLQQRVNICKGIDLATPVQFYEKIDAAAKYFSAGIKKGDVLASTLPLYSTFNPTDSQIREWCNRVLDGTSMSM